MSDGETSDVGSGETLEIGQLIPEVEALLCDGEVFRPASLEEVLGERGMVLSFYGFSFSAIAVNWWNRYSRYGWDGFEGVPVLGACRDGPYAVNAFLREIDSPFEVFADVDGEIADAFGLRRRRDDMPNASTPRRAVYVFGSDGEATYRWLSEDDVSPQDVDEIESAVDAL